MECKELFNRLEQSLCCPVEPTQQRHVHEVLGSVEITGCGREAHNHRFATMSGEAIPVGGSDHVHEVQFRTDFYDDHFHAFAGRSGGAVDVGGGRHVHFAEAQTTVNDGHQHSFRVAAFIQDPTVN